MIIRLLIGLVVVAVLAVLVLEILLRTRVSDEFPVQVQVRGFWQGRFVKLHYDHWLPRFLHAYGVSSGPHIWLRDGPPGKDRVGRPVTQRWMVAHELGHRVRWAREPDFQLGLIFWTEMLLPHRERAEEWLAEYWRKPITDGTSGVLRDTGGWLARVFPDNDQEPPDPER